jgi:hypothetical protein
METTSLPVTPTLPLAPLTVANPCAEPARWIDPAITNIDHLLSGATRDKVLAITNNLFPGQATCRVDEDPEYSGYRYQVIEAQASGDPADIVTREIAWHRQIVCHFPELAALRLSLSFQ